MQPECMTAEEERTDTFELPGFCSHTLCAGSCASRMAAQLPGSREAEPAAEAEGSAPSDSPGRLELHLLLLLVVGVVLRRLPVLGSQEVKHVKRRLPEAKGGDT